MGTILAVDGNSILNRAFYGVRPLTNKDGLQTGAVFGALNIIMSHAERLNADGVAVAFDRHAPTFRHKMFAGYKANRHGMPDELAQQLPYIKKALTMLGYRTFEMDGFEGDDILGTIAKTAESGDNSVYILTGDRDLLQLISDKTKVLLIGNSETKLYTREEFSAKYLIPVESYVDLKALMGDSSDCIPGVPGVGEKTAQKIIMHYGSIDELYADTDSLSCGASLKTKLIEGKENAYLSKQLAKITDDVPLGISTSDLLLKAQDNDGLYKLFTELEFSSFIRRLNLQSHVENNISETKKVTLDILPELSGKIYAAVVGNVLYIADNTDSYSCEFNDFSELKDLFRPDVKLTVFNSKKLYRKLFEIGIYDYKVDFDIMLAAYALNPSETVYEFNKICGVYLGTEIEEKNVGIFEKLESVLKEKIEKDNLTFIYYSLELPLAYLLAKMEAQGFKIDRDSVGEYSTMLDGEIHRTRQLIYELAGCEFNVNSPKQLREVLYEKLSLPYLSKTKRTMSTNADVLEKLLPYHPIIELILEYRKLMKLQGTYTDGLLRVADDNGIVHTEFKQTGTVTGRLSSAEPNLQNIPVKTKEGREIRKFFVPMSNDRCLIDADYSQIELRILAHLSKDENMISAFINNEDIHRNTAAKIFGVSEDDVTPEMRSKAKSINFGLVYGMGDYTLAQEIKVSYPTAASYIKSYFDSYSGIKAYLEGSVKEAAQKGYSETIFGRRRYIPELASGKGSLRSFGERVAKNAPIQGSAADIIKIAMINTDKALTKAGLDAKLILQVHDELIIDSSEKDSEKAGEILRNEMENAVKLSVPLTVELKIGKTWYDCK